MRHRKDKAKLDRNSPQRRRLVRNMAVSLIVRGKLTTTKAKAAVVRSLVERSITRGKEGTIAARRWLSGTLNNDEAAKKVLTELSPKYLKRAGGYTRVVRLAPRQGDNADQMIITFVE